MRSCPEELLAAQEVLPYGRPVRVVALMDEANNATVEESCMTRPNKKHEAVTMYSNAHLAEPDVNVYDARFGDAVCNDSWSQDCGGRQKSATW